jgi:hypothetical protein
VSGKSNFKRFYGVVKVISVDGAHAIKLVLVGDKSHSLVSEKVIFPCLKSSFFSCENVPLFRVRKLIVRIENTISGHLSGVEIVLFSVEIVPFSVEIVPFLFRNCHFLSKSSFLFDFPLSLEKAPLCPPMLSAASQAAPDGHAPAEQPLRALVPAQLPRAQDLQFGG